MGERERKRSPEPEPVDRYEQVLNEFEAVRNRASRPHVIQSGDVPWAQSRQGKLKYYSMQEMDNTPLPQFLIIRHEIAEKSGRHTHQGGLVLFGLRGEGATLVDEERVEWGQAIWFCSQSNPAG